MKTDYLKPHSHRSIRKDGFKNVSRLSMGFEPLTAPLLPIIFNCFGIQHAHSV